MSECCFIGCIKPAKFWIGRNSIDRYTHSCEDHVEDLKEDGDTVEAIGSAHVIDVEEDQEADSVEPTDTDDLPFLADPDGGSD